MRRDSGAMLVALGALFIAGILAVDRIVTGTPMTFQQRARALDLAERQTIALEKLAESRWFKNGK